MRSRVDGLIALAVIHLGIACASSVTGAASARTVPSGTRVPGLVWEEAGRIYSNNLRALAVLLVSGALVVGVAGIILFALNGHVFGQMVVASRVEVAWLWLFAPLELAAFAVGAAASMEIGLGLVRWLRDGVPIGAVHWERCGAAVLMAAAGLAVAAVLEGVAIRWAWHP